jgi:hypothetical protein
MFTMPRQIAMRKNCAKGSILAKKLRFPREMKGVRRAHVLSTYRFSEENGT